MADYIFGELIHQYNEDEFLYRGKASNVCKILVNWAENRPSCAKKIGEILDTLRNGTFIFSQPVYVGEIIRDDGIKYVVYDGNHRVSALKQYCKEIGRIDRDTDDIPLYINLLRNRREKEITERFIILNKTTPLPDMYRLVDKTEAEVAKDLINPVIDMICNQFPKNHSTSQSPRRPHFNKTSLSNQLLDYVIESNNQDMTSNDLYHILVTLNARYKQEYYNNNSKDKFWVKLPKTVKKNVKKQIVSYLLKIL